MAILLYDHKSPNKNIHQKAEMKLKLLSYLCLRTQSLSYRNFKEEQKSVSPEAAGSCHSRATSEG